MRTKRTKGEMMKNRVYVACPTFDYTVIGSTLGALLACKKDPETSAEWFVHGFSGLTANFNNLFVEALNGIKTRGITHFAMLHADIEPEQYWLDRMLRIMEDWQADIVSVISPVKNGTGLTSTAYENPENPWYPIRFTVRQLGKMPPTFTQDDLLINTGLMLVDLRKDWVKKICFHVEDKITEIEPGVFRAHFF